MPRKKRGEYDQPPPTAKPPRVLAIDHSLTKAGYAAWHATERFATNLRGQERVEAHRAYLANMLATVCPELVVFEGYAYGSTNSSMASTAECRGVLLHLLWLHRVPVVHVPPVSLKYWATGRNASKDEMIEAVERATGQRLDDDQADATALHAMALHAYGHPQAFAPTDQRARYLRGVPWPVLEVD